MLIIINTIDIPFVKECLLCILSTFVNISMLKLRHQHYFIVEENFALLNKRCHHAHISHVNELSSCGSYIN